MSEVKPPIAAARNDAQVLDDLRARLPGYVPGLSAEPGTVADALHRIFSGYATLVRRAVNDALPRAQLSFLDACGESRRPPQEARVPLVWKLNERSPVDVTLPPGATVAARTGAASGDEPPTFIAAQSIVLARAQLAAAYSINPLEDRWADHTSRLATGFTFFETSEGIEHAIYLGHDHLFKLPARSAAKDDQGGSVSSRPDATIILHVGLVEGARAVREDLRMKWECWTASGWLPLDGAIADLLIADGQVDLRKNGGPASAEREILGRKSYWIRGTTTDPLARASAPTAGALPVIDSVRASLDFGHDDVRIDAAFVDGRPLDTSAPFLPFGASTVRGTTFHLGCSDAFGRPGARVKIAVAFAKGDDGSKSPQPAQGPIAWEYFNGSTWKPLGVSDTTGVFMKSPALPPKGSDGLLTFVAPGDWATSTIGRSTSHFIRARLDGESVFGAVPAFTGNAFSQGSMKPPLVNSLKTSYSHITEPTPVDHGLVANGGVFRDVTQAARFPQSTFQPFEPIGDTEPAIYLAFDQRLPQGLVSLFADVPQDSAVDPVDSSSPFVWEYLSSQPDDWRELGAIDDTRGFRVSGLIQFVGPFDHTASAGPRGTLFRIRARLKQGARLTPRRIDGLWLNAVMATHAASVTGEFLGQSTGQPRQLLLFPQSRTPILPGEQIDIREWSGRDRGYEAITDAVAKPDWRSVTDPATGEIVEVWVRWRVRPHLLDARPDDRVYTLDRIAGAVRFGDGQRGRIPPGGAPISVTFRTGGGLSGNVPTGSVSEPRAAILFLESVANPRPARGGSDAEAVEVTRVRGAERLRHRGRALAARDFEWLALEASPAVARARCLQTTGPAGAGQRGWVTVVIVPYSDDRRPQPDEELVARVRAYLAERVSATLVRHIQIIGPKYQPVSVVADVVPLRPEDASDIDTSIRRQLQEFLHPLRGGLDGRGWHVGQAVPLSRVAALIESTAGVEFARDVSLHVDGAVYGDEVPGTADALVASGDHDIRLTLRGDAC